MSYYEDLYGNQYRWATKPDYNGKYEAEIYKLKKGNNYNRYYFQITNRRIFSRRRMAKAWCLKHVRKAKARQQIVIDGREVRRQERLDAKPKYSKLQLEILKLQKEVDNHRRSLIKGDTKIKTLTTRRNTLVKTIKSKRKLISNRVIKMETQH